MPILEPAGAPSWWSRVAKSIRDTLKERPGAPSKLWEVDSTDLPSAASYRGCIAYCPDLSQPVVSDGTDWFPITLGAAI